MEIPPRCPSNITFIDLGYKGTTDKTAQWLRKKIIQCALEFYVSPVDRLEFMSFIEKSSNKTVNKLIRRLCEELMEDNGELKDTPKPAFPPPPQGRAFGLSGGDAPPSSHGKKSSKASKKKTNSMNITKSKNNSSSNNKMVNIT